MKILLTGAAGFIGMTTTLRLLARGDTVVGLDNLNDYYEVSLKHNRLARLTPHPNFRFVQMDVADRPGMEKLFADERFDRVIHLAAQAGVRYSHRRIRMCTSTATSTGFLHTFSRAAVTTKVEHLVYASTSSACMAPTRSMPFAVDHDSVDHPMTLYAATKKANELMAHSYSLAVQACRPPGLRFFTVYGPWGRPDMALFLFTKAILEGRPSTCSTTATCSATSPSSTTSSKASSG